MQGPQRVKTALGLWDTQTDKETYSSQYIASLGEGKITKCSCDKASEYSFSECLYCSRSKQGQSVEADDLKEATLVMGEELTSLRLYADLLRARFAGTVIQQQERLRHMTREVRLSPIHTTRISGPYIYG